LHGAGARDQIGGRRGEDDEASGADDLRFGADVVGGRDAIGSGDERRDAGAGGGDEASLPHENFLSAVRVGGGGAEVRGAGCEGNIGGIRRDAGFGAWSVARSGAIRRGDKISGWGARGAAGGAIASVTKEDLRGDAVERDSGDQIRGERDEGDVAAIRTDGGIVTVGVSGVDAVGRHGDKFAGVAGCHRRKAYRQPIDLAVVLGKRNSRNQVGGRRGESDVSSGGVDGGFGTRSVGRNSVGPNTDVGCHGCAVAPEAGGADKDVASRIGLVQEEVGGRGGERDKGATRAD